MRIKYGVPLTAYQRSTFYALEEPHGYVDYPAATVAQLMGEADTATPRVKDTAGPSTVVLAA